MSVGRTTKLPDSDNGNWDERQPLLVASRSDAETIVSTSDPEEQSKIERPNRLGWKSYTFYGILFILAILLIKAFIDTGDVEVRTALPLIFCSNF